MIIPAADKPPVVDIAGLSMELIAAGYTLTVDGDRWEVTRRDGSEPQNPGAVISEIKKHSGAPHQSDPVITDGSVATVYVLDGSVYAVFDGGKIKLA